jgi:hypothetical protein
MPRNLDDAIHALKSFIDEEIKSTAGSSVYHYTDHAGLIGIAQSGTLWTSHAFLLNDPSEELHALEVLKTAIESKKDGLGANYNRLLEALADAATQRDGFYVACFSRKKDDLTQWRAYGKNGSGYAIGMRQEELIESCKNDSSVARWSPQFVKVRYDGQMILERAIETLVEASDLRGILTSESAATIAKQIFSELGRLLSAIKHPGFAAEEEERLILSVPNNSSAIQFRGSSNHVVPFIRLAKPNSKNLPIDRIVVGPTLNSARAVKAARLLLENSSYNVNDIPIVPSEIPYAV